MPDATYCPTERELDDLELLLNGGYLPQQRFDDVITIDVTGPLDLVDPEGFPLAHLDGDGNLTPYGSPAYGPFRSLFKTAEQTRMEYPDALTVALAAAPTSADLAHIHDVRDGRPVVLLALCGSGTPVGLTRVGLIRACLAAADLLLGASVVAVPLPAHDDSALDHTLGQRVAHNFAAGDVMALTHEGDYPSEIAAVVASDTPDPRGLVVFFTGLSGSGKSTVARALNDVLLEAGERTVTSLDGDVVRRHLSAGLGFSREDRETNIRRIGWVGAEISRHGGVAICSPIAPFDQTRKAVRAMTEAAGGDFVLIHIATPLEECERRDRKGLYAKARAGEIPDFTGISSPYEVPEDADLTIDTTGRSVDDVVDEVLAILPWSRRRTSMHDALLLHPLIGGGWDHLFSRDALSVLVVAFGVGIVVGLTGMGGGALMTPALIFLGINPAAAVANDLVAAGINKSVGAGVHWRRGSPNLKLAMYLVVGSVPFALAGGFIVNAVGKKDAQTAFLNNAIGWALLLAATSYALRIFLQLRHVRADNTWSEAEIPIRPIPTLLVGAVGGLLVGITSVGSGSLIMVALLLLYPRMTAVRLVGTDLVQAVPLVVAAAVGHVINTGVDSAILIPLIIGGTPGTLLGSRLASWVSQSVIRNGIVVVLTLTGLKMLGVPPEWVGIIGAGMLLLGPLVWGFVRQIRGLPAFDNDAAAWQVREDGSSHEEPS